jgi:hypothetical protein
MPDIDIPLTEELLNKNFQKMLYLPASLQVFIWHDNKPIVVAVDLASMTKTAENLIEVFNGTVDDETRQELILNMSKGLAPYFKYEDNDGITEEYRQALDDAINKPKLDNDLEEELAKEIPNKEYSEFVISTVKKEVKREDSLIRQIFLTGISTYTYEPLNLAILGPTSEGKTYAVKKVMQYFPDNDVWRIGDMSPMALVRQHGVLINSKGKPIQKQVDELKERIENVNTAEFRLDFVPPKVKEDKQKAEPTPSEKVKQRQNEIKKELRKITEGASRLIDLTGKILFFLEPPNPKLMNILKPILSHDEPEIRHDYVDNTDKAIGIETKYVVTRGWPVVIFCSATDVSLWKVWPEIQSRFLVASPNMTEEKVHDGNMLIAQRKGLPNSIQQKIIVSDKDRELARKCVLYTKDWINRLSGSNEWSYEHPNTTWIPYQEILASALKADRGTDNRIANRIFTFLNIIPLVKSHLRQTLLYGKERLPIATLDDLSETLHITQNMSGIPTHKIKFYREIIIPLYESKEGEPDYKGNNVEDRPAVTTSQICDYYKLKTGRVINSDSVRKTYLNELMINAYLDEQDSILDKRQKIYWPIIEIPKEENIKEYRKINDSRNFLQYSPIIPSRNFKEIPENWLKLAISFLQNNRNELDDFQLIDENEDEMSIWKFVENYEKEGSLILYFKKPKSCNYYSEIFGEMKELHIPVPEDVNNCGNESESHNSLFSEIPTEPEIDPNPAAGGENPGGNSDPEPDPREEDPSNPSSNKVKCPYCDYIEHPFYLKIHRKNAHEGGL